MVERTPRLVGEARQAMAAELAGRYHDGASIRSLARESGRSYGLVQKLLREAGVEFRPRGGADPASPEAHLSAPYPPEPCRNRRSRLSWPSLRTSRAEMVPTEAVMVCEMRSRAARRT